jgi:hypothetical protein
MKAYELIDKPEKWSHINWSGVEKDEQGNIIKRCLVVALNEVYGDKSIDMKPDIQAHLGINYPLSIWNDAPERTWKEVYGLLKELDI